MSTDDVLEIEDRLRAALSARAELVRPEDLGPLAPVVPLRPRWQSPWVLLATAAVVLLIVGAVFQTFSGDPRSDRLAPKPGPQVEIPQDVGRDWKADDLSTPARLDLDGDGTKERVEFLAEETKDFDGRIRLQTTLSSTGEEAYGVAQLESTIGTYARDPIDADGDGDQELVLPYESIGGPGEPAYPIVFDLRDGLLVEAPVVEPELLQLGITPVDGGTEHYDLFRSQTYWIEDQTLFSMRSVSTFAVAGMSATRPQTMVFDSWRWRLDDEGVLRPEADGCVVETPTGDVERCGDDPRDSLPVVAPVATGSFGMGEQHSWTEGYPFEARLDAVADPVLVVEGSDGRTLDHPLEVADPRVLTTQPTAIFYDGASVVVTSASDPAYLQVLWQQGDRLRALVPVGDVPLTNDGTHRSWLTEEGSLVTLVAGEDGTWRAWFWQMVSRTEMAAMPAGTVCFDDVDDPSTAREC